MPDIARFPALLPVYALLPQRDETCSIVCAGTDG